MADMASTVDTEQDDQQQPDPVELFMQGAGRTGDSGPGGGWGDLFAKAAAGPRISRPPLRAPEPATDAAASPEPAASSDPGNAKIQDKLALPRIGQAFAGDTGSEAGRALGEFADATGSNPAPGGANLAKLGAPPTPPTIDPAFAQTQADLRAKSAVTPKFDPTTGKVLDKYHEGLGGRIGRAFLDAGKGFLRGGVRGAAGATLEGAFGNKNAPGYFGKDAVSGQYFKDEAGRQQQVDADTRRISSFQDENKTLDEQFKDKQANWKDTYDVARNQDVDELKQQGAEEKKQHDIEIENVRGQLAEARDPEAKAKAEVKARQSIADQLKLPPGYARDSYVTTGKYPDEETIARRAQALEDRVGLQRDRNEIERDRVQLQREKEASKKGSATFKDAPAIDKYSDQWYSRQRDQVRKDKAEALKNAGGVTGKAQSDYTEIENSYKARAQEFEGRKAGWYSQVNAGKPVAVKEPEGGGVPDDAGLPAAEFSPRTGAPVPGAEAHTNDGGAAQLAVTGKDSKGRPAMSVQPKPQLTPIPDKQANVGGRTYKISDTVKVKSTGETKIIKGFSKDADGKIHATF